MNWNDGVIAASRADMRAGSFPGISGNVMTSLVCARGAAWSRIRSSETRRGPQSGSQAQTGHVRMEEELSHSRYAYVWHGIFSKELYVARLEE